MNGLQVKAENERFTAVGSQCCQNVKYEILTLSFGRAQKKNCTKKHDTRAAHDHFSLFTQSSLICGIVIS